MNLAQADVRAHTADHQSEVRAQASVPMHLRWHTLLPGSTLEHDELPARWDPLADSLSVLFDGEWREVRKSRYAVRLRNMREATDAAIEMLVTLESGLVPPQADQLTEVARWLMVMRAYTRKQVAR